ncbi:unnamed protein product [Gongylonema pulchrum]|uniref:Defective in cullin neddylation protein n=1 Tax=Gongylonema pulchrum TaxID=637853 RepID=A0A183EUY4_9BILA|nr:unnamed protein product [Gongylonema pulchrum]
MPFSFVPYFWPPLPCLCSLHKIVPARIEHFADRQDADPSRIGPHGMLRFLTELGLDAEDRNVLILAWKLRAKTQCEFTWQEFSTGLTEMRVDTLDKLKAKIPLLNDELRNPQNFRDFYQFTFNYARVSSQRTLGE